MPPKKIKVIDVIDDDKKDDEYTDIVDEIIALAKILWDS